MTNLGGSRSLTQPYILRQTDTPNGPSDGLLWINPSGGANGNNSERYIYDGANSEWELTNSVGPDAPLYAVSGAMWRDTANSKQKVYDGSSWVNVGVTDHANLANVTASQHHSRPTGTQSAVNRGSYDSRLGGYHTVTDDSHDDGTAVTASVSSKFWRHDETRIRIYIYGASDSYPQDVEVSNLRYTVDGGSTTTVKSGVFYSNSIDGSTYKIYDTVHSQGNPYAYESTWKVDYEYVNSASSNPELRLYHQPADLEVTSHTHSI